MFLTLSTWQAGECGLLVTSYRDEMKAMVDKAMASISPADIITEMLMQGVNPSLFKSAVEAVKENDEH